MNNIWTSTFALPDWDMFHSGHKFGPFHAAARALSGGPLYVSDKPENSDITLIKKLCTADGRAMRCDQPALPAESCLFVNCLKQPKLFKIFNRHHTIGLLGFFHCRQDNSEAITDSFSAADIPGLKGTQFAVYLHMGKTLLTLDKKKKQALNLPAFGYEVAIISPITRGLAPIGLAEKFNSPWVFESIAIKENYAEFGVRESGNVFFYSEKRPRHVTRNGKKTAFKYDSKLKKLQIAVQCGDMVRIG